MKNHRVLVTAVAAAAFLAGCGGGSEGNQSPRIAFARMVSFGDSLSDVGSYKTQLVEANGVGEYSINGDFSKSGLPYTNWTEYLSATLQLAPPCASEVGLASVGALAGLAQTPVTVAGCFNYAEGGSRVTNPVGPGNSVLYTMFGSASGQLGQLTIPVTTQIANFLAANTAFSDSDLVTVLAGGNDVLLVRGLNVDGTVQTVLGEVAAGLITQDQANAAIAAAANDAVDQMTTAGHELAALVNTQIIANGATHVVVVNVPDVANTPDAEEWLTAGAGVYVEPIHPDLTREMTTAFNAALAADLQVDATTQASAITQITFVDAFGRSDDQVVNPGPYGLTNLTTPACDPAKTGLSSPAGFIPLDSSLFCSAATLIPVDTANVTDVDPTGLMHYLYADSVHPTPFGYRLLAEYVGLKMAIKGWL